MEVKELHTVIGKRIRYFRKKRKLTQEYLRKHLGYTSKGTMSHIEHGKMGMRTDRLFKLASLLDVEPSLLTTALDLADEDLEVAEKFTKLMRDPHRSRHYPAIKILIDKAQTE